MTDLIGIPERLHPVLTALECDAAWIEPFPLAVQAHVDRMVAMDRHDTLSQCRHAIKTAPQLMIWSPREPGRLRCVTCAYIEPNILAMPPSVRRPEAFPAADECDSCRRKSDAIVRCMAIHPPAFLLLHICDSCLNPKVSPSIEPSRTSETPP